MSAADVARPTESPAEMPAPAARGRLRDYALWQMRDYLINKGIGTALVSGLLLFLTWVALRSAEAAMVAAGRVPDVTGIVQAAFPEFVDKLVLFSVLFATNGLVSEDRKFGYYRFYFAKPVSAPAFYGQKFAVHILGVLLVAAVMLGVHALAIQPFFPPAFFPVVTMLVIGLAGIGFLISALFTFDWISLLAVYAAALIGWLLFADAGGVRGALVRLLPPVHQLGSIYRAVTFGQPIPMEPLWWIFIYGLVCLVIGLVVIARRPLATT